MEQNKSTLSRRRVLARGAGLFAAFTAASALLELPATTAHAALGSDIDFAWCNRCMVLHRRHDADLPYQLCAAGGDHSYPYPTSGEYLLYCNNTHPPVPQQSGWAHCGRCSTVFYLGAHNNSRCVGGGPHVPAGPDNYNMLQSPYGNNTQAGWRWCNKCMALFFFGSATRGVCTVYASVTGWGHDPAGSGSYYVTNLGNDKWVGAKQ